LTASLQPHATSIVTWDVPSAVVSGERFRMKVGIKCAAECPLAGGAVGIFDHHGAQVAAGTLPDVRWPGTAALYAVEVEIPAPAEEGFYAWSARGPQSRGETPHAEGTADFAVRVVGSPVCLVRVEARDREGGQPLSGARLVMHPYRAAADGGGVAQVRVAKGAYTLFVSQTGYVTFRALVDVTTDMTVRAELSLEPESERN
jgi:hypothetical protein